MQLGMGKRVLVASAVLAVCAWAQAADGTSLVQGEGQRIYGADVTADAQRIPEEMRTGFLARPASVQELASNLYVRRVMADKGIKAGVDKSEQVQAAIRIAVDKIISDAYLVKFDAEHMPAEKVIDAQAKAAYQAKKNTLVEPEKVRTAHILISGDTEESKKKAEKLLKELKAGADFAVLAKDNSEDPGSAVKGGDLGTFPRGRMVKEFENAAFNLKKPGDLSGLVKSQFGYHIIKLEEKHAAKQLSFAEAEPQLRKQVTVELLNKERIAAVKKVTDAMTADAAAIEAYSKQFEKQ